MRLSSWLKTSLVVVAVFACDRGPTDVDAPDTPLVALEAFDAIVSDPVVVDGSTAVYVSIPSGTVATADRVTITRRGGVAMTVPMSEGGLDPIAFPAMQGDTLRLSAIDSNRRAFSTTSIVPASTPPRVVRTSPPRGKTSVPLNTRIEVVFSEPVDAASLTHDSFYLLQGGQTPVAGHISLGDTGVVARFTPAAPLQAGVGYVVHVTTAVKDRSGTALDSALSSDFQTVLPPPPLTWIQLEPGQYLVASGSSLVLRPQPHSGNAPVLDAPVRWSSADPAIATVDSTGTVQAIANGATVITVRSAAGDTMVKATAAITVPPTTPLQFTSVSAGAGFTCALTADHRVYCWGQNSVANLGNSGPMALAPVPSAGTASFGTVSSGAGHVCALTTAKHAYCWGQADVNQLGQPGPFGGTTCDYYPWASRWEEIMYGGDGPCDPQPLAVAGVPPFAALSSGGGHACALDAGGTAYCWGADSERERGAGFTAHRFPPARVHTTLTFASITAGSWTTCGVTAAGDAYCWGSIAGSQTAPLPSLVSSTLKFQQIAIAGWFICGIVTGGEVYCWGDSSLTPNGAMAPLETDLRFSSIDGGERHMCALAISGAAYCWGANGSGQLGNDSLSTTALTQRVPRTVAGGLHFGSISAGAYHTCGLTTEGTVYCWGSNYGALGIGTTTDHRIPARVLGQAP
jgi:alpha-tubulin suppressor-like RCC1 family protein